MSGFRDWKFYNGEVRDSSGQLELEALRRHVRALEVRLDELADENERLKASRRGLSAALGAMSEEQKCTVIDRPALEFPEHGCAAEHARITNDGRSTARCMG